MPPERAPFLASSHRELPPRAEGRTAAPAPISRWGVRPRLVAIVLVPLLGLFVLGGSVTIGRHRTAQDALSITEKAARLDRLVAARNAFYTESFFSGILTILQRPDLSPDVTVSLLGLDPAVRLRTSMATTDAAVDALGDDQHVLPRAQVDRLRGMLKSWVFDDPAVTAEISTIMDELNEAVSSAMTDLAGSTRSMTRAGELVSAMQAIRTSSEALVIVNDAFATAGLAFVENAMPNSTNYNLAGFNTRLDQTTELLDDVQIPSIATAWAALRSGPDVETFAAGLDQAIAMAGSYGGSGIDFSGYAAFIRSWLGYGDGLLEVTRAAIGAVRDIAGDMRAAALRELWAWSGFTALAVAVLAASSAWFAASILRPLRRLSQRASRISQGELDLKPVTRPSQREMATTFQAVDELAANLRLLEAKAQALSACDFDAPVLQASVPGALGESLQRSVQVLSGSIVERDELQRHLAHQATHDVLTGLPNRAAATTTLEQALRRAQRLGGAVAVLFIDLDEFKPVNDVHGHAVGDEVLRTVADRMALLVRGSDFLARLGGDEFVVVTEAAEDAAGVAQLADRLILAAGDPITVGDLSVQVGASVGIAFALDGNEDADQLLTCADLAVYRAKQHGRNRSEIYDSRMQEDLVARAQIRDALGQAIRNDELYLDYQPVFTAHDSQMCGVEALVRWDRPGFGPQPPDSFIPQAEESPRLIVALDCWVLDQAARQLKAWEDDPDMAHLAVAVNISGRHLVSRDLVDHVTAVIERTGIDPRHLVLEITETVLLNDLDIAAEQLEQLRAMGTRIAIDDFGTGYTSVTHLAHLPVDVLKIDRSFLADQLDHRATNLLAMMIDLGHHLGLDITAEGVETADQLRVLRRLACDHTQGFLLGRPQPPQRFTDPTTDETPALPGPTDA